MCRWCPNNAYSDCLQTRALWRFCRYLILTAIPFKLVNDAAQFVGPLFLNLLLNVVSSGQPSYLGYSYAILMFVLLVIGTLSDNQHFQRVMRAGGLGATSWQAGCSMIPISCLGCQWQARLATDSASSASCGGRWAGCYKLLSGELQHGAPLHSCNAAHGHHLHSLVLPARHAGRWALLSVVGRLHCCRAVSC